MPSEIPSALPRLESSRWKNPLIGLMLLAYGVILWVGMSTSVSLGDEVYHYRFAKAAFAQKSRPVVDPLYLKSEAPVKVRFVTDPLWPLGLASLWSFLGKISSAAAQVYHSVYFLILLGAVFFLGKTLYSLETGLWSCFLAATVPMLLSFSMIMYTDLPATALFMAAFYFFSRKRFVPAGILLAAAFLTKKVVLCFVPGMLLWLLVLLWPQKKKMTAAFFVFLIPVIITAVVENHWQTTHIPHMLSISQGLSARLDGIYNPHASEAPSFFIRIFNSIKNNEFSNSNLINLKDEAKYFGLVMPVCFLISLFKLRLGQKEWLLVLASLSYFSGVLFLRLLPDIRYLMPLAPFFCILAARFLAPWPGKVIKLSAVLICAVQLFAVGGYVLRERKIPQALMEGFHYVEAHVPEHAMVLYPDITLAEYANRPMVWGLFGIRNFFWGTEQESLLEMKQASIRYIAFKNARSYDDTATGLRHIGGYPLSFLKRLKAWSFATLIFENEAVSLWKIDPEKMNAVYLQLSAEIPHG